MRSAAACELTPAPGGPRPGARRSGRFEAVTPLPVPLALALCAAGLAAQSAVVSPAWFAGYEGESALSYPLSGKTIRYQQVHDDLRGSPMAMQGIGWRRDGEAISLLPIARAVEIELRCAPGDVTRFGLAFDQNFQGAPTTVFDRKKVNLPDRTPDPTQQPMPFDVLLAFDRAYQHGSGQDWVWELRMYSSTAQLGDHYLSDAVVPGAPVPVMRRQLGTGCAVNQTQPGVPMRLDSDSVVTPAGTWLASWYCHAGPPSPAWAAVLIGTTNPALTVPGLCAGKLYTDAAMSLPAQLPIGQEGGFRTAPATLPWGPVLAGLKLYAQAFAPDANQTGIPLAASSGLESLLPASPPPVFRWYRIVASDPAAASAYAVLTGGVVTRIAR